MQITYERDGMHSYLVLEQIEEDLRRGYEYQMVLQNLVPGLLPCQERLLEGTAALRYEISGRQSLADSYSACKMSGTDMERLLEALAAAFASCDQYLLDAGSLELRPQQIYRDAVQETFWFLYLPGFIRGEHPYRELAEFFLDRMEQTDESAVQLAYDFYRQIKRFDFDLNRFLAGREAGRRLKGAASAPDFADTGYQDIDGVTGERQEGADHFQKYAVSMRADIGKIKQEETVPTEENKNKEYERRNDKKQDTGKGLEKREVRQALSYGMAAGVMLAVLGAVYWYYLVWICKYSDFPDRGKIILSQGIAVVGSLLAAANGIGMVLHKRNIIKKQEEKQDSDAEAIWEAFAGRSEQNDRDWEMTIEAQNQVTRFIGGQGRDLADGSRQHRLIGIGGSDAIEYTFSELPVIVGKLQGQVGIRVEEFTVSRIHARFFRKEGKIAVMDLNSTNGTFVNGIRLEPGEQVILESQDEICFGQARFLFE